MATRALATVAGRRGGGRQAGLAVLSSSASGSACRRGGGTQSGFSRSSSSAAEREGVTAAQVEAEAAPNRKNVEVFQNQGDGSGSGSATLLAADVGDGDGAAGAEDAWLPDQETGVFVPADEAASSGDGDGHNGSAPPSSVLDQAVFVREEEMEDVERPAAGAK